MKQIIYKITLNLALFCIVSATGFLPVSESYAAAPVETNESAIEQGAEVIVTQSEDSRMLAISARNDCADLGNAGKVLNFFTAINLYQNPECFNLRIAEAPRQPTIAVVTKTTNAKVVVEKGPQLSDSSTLRHSNYKAPIGIILPALSFSTIDSKHSDLKTVLSNPLKYKVSFVPQMELSELMVYRC